MLMCFFFNCWFCIWNFMFSFFVNCNEEYEVVFLGVNWNCSYCLFWICVFGEYVKVICLCKFWIDIVVLDV